MSRPKEALIIGTQVATINLESGASLRLQSVKFALEKSNFNVSVSPLNLARSSLNKNWDLIVVVSYSSARILRRARKQSKFLWFDPTDSWTVSRLSLFHAGDFKQILMLMRDLYWVWRSPKIDLLTFITKRDAIAEKIWWKSRTEPLIFPISDLVRKVNPSNEIKYVFVGDGDYRPNKEALVFLAKVLDYLKDGVVVDVYGKNFHSDDPRFRMHGYTKNSEIYSERDIHLAPVTSGAGLKLKVAIPLLNGIPVVTTTEGANGFKKSDLLKLADSPEDFAKAVDIFVDRYINQSQSSVTHKPFEDDDSQGLLIKLSSVFDS